MNTVKFKNRRSILCVLLILLSGLLVLGGVFRLFDGRHSRANAQVNIAVSQEIATEYAFGDTFTIPDCTFEKDGTSAQGIAALQYPDGTQTSEKSVSLNQSGEYVLRYIATINEKVYTKEYAFTVYGRLASYSNNKTSLEYGLCTHLGANTEGLMVKIANGDSISFDHVFDMQSLTMSTKLLEGFIVPNTQGTADFAKMVFTFTDLEDPSVQLVYHGNFHNDSNAYGLTFFTAAGNGQIHCGLEYVGRLHVGSTLGCMVPHSFIAMDTGLYYGAKAPEPAAPDSKTFCISYDAKSNQAWAGGKIISDLDDSNYYSSLWFGFPSGKAKLSISALNYNDATANICFTSILGVDLSAEHYVDDEAPTITVDTEYETMPVAVVGKNYPIPAATAADRVSGACDVDVSVWYNYGAADQKMVNITDGRFLADKVGVYAIVYEATDYSGNTSRTVLWVRANLIQYIRPQLSVSIDDGFNTEIEVGTLQSLPEVVAAGGSGNKTLSFTITKGDKTCEIKDGKFRLEEAGQWTLTCTAVDYVGTTKEAKCVLNGVVGDKPILMDEPNLPTAYVSGSAYELPVLYAYDYSSGTQVRKTCTVSVTYNGTTATYQSGESFVPTVENHGESIAVAYTCDGETVFEREIPVFVVFGRERIPGATERYRDVINVEKYFYTQDALTFTNKYKIANVSGLKISADEEMENAKMSFINPQMANGFSLSFFTVPNESKFSRLGITLTDSENSNISLRADLVKDEGQTLMVVGDTVLTLTMDFDAAVATPFSIGFDGNSFIVNQTTSVAVSKTENKEAFDGFPSGKVYFDIEMQDVAEGAAIFLQKIGSINVNNTIDNTGPSISTKENVVTNAFKDSVYTVQRVFACDVLCPNSEARLTVIDPNGEVVTSVDGILLSGVDATKDYQIQLTAYGDYTVSVVATEAKGWKEPRPNESYFSYGVTVTDGEAPTITFEKDFAQSLKVGDTLIIPKYTVADNHTVAEEITVIKMIINPKGMPVYLYGETNAIRCEYAGLYQIKIYVYDKMGNLTVVEKTVSVQ